MEYNEYVSEEFNNSENKIDAAILYDEKFKDDNIKIKSIDNTVENWKNYIYKIINKASNDPPITNAQYEI